MSVQLRVVGQRITLASAMEPVVAGSTEFVKFSFKFSKEWDGMITFAQFSQCDNTYNVYLDENDCVNLPPDIEAGKCRMVLYGVSESSHGVSDAFVFNVEDNGFVRDENSTEITPPIYDQIIAMVAELRELVDQIKDGDLEEVVEARENSETGEVYEMLKARLDAEYLELSNKIDEKVDDGSFDEVLDELRSSIESLEENMASKIVLENVASNLERERQERISADNQLDAAKADIEEIDAVRAEIAEEASYRENSYNALYDQKADKSELEEVKESIVSRDVIVGLSTSIDDEITQRQTEIARLDNAKVDRLELSDEIADRINADIVTRRLIDAEEYQRILENNSLSDAIIFEGVVRNNAINYLDSIKADKADIDEKADRSELASLAKVSDLNIVKDLAEDLSDRLNALADSDDDTLDQISEIVAYIKNNKSLIDSITTSKVSVSDIVDSLTSVSTVKPLSAKQGKVLKDLIDTIVVPKILVNGTEQQVVNKSVDISVPTKASDLVQDIAGAKIVYDEVKDAIKLSAPN